MSSLGIHITSSPDDKSVPHLSYSIRVSRLVFCIARYSVVPKPIASALAEFAQPVIKQLTLVILYSKVSHSLFALFECPGHSETFARGEGKRRRAHALSHKYPPTPRDIETEIREGGREVGG
jgi:hypothetical protein